jgi:hypothetical protein
MGEVKKRQGAGNPKELPISKAFADQPWPEGFKDQASRMVKKLIQPSGIW